MKTVTYVGDYLDGSIGYRHAKSDLDTYLPQAVGEVPYWLHVCYVITSRLNGLFEKQLTNYVKREEDEQ